MKPRSLYRIRPHLRVDAHLCTEEYGYVLEHGGRERLWFPLRHVAELALKLARRDEARRRALRRVDPTVVLVPPSSMHHHHTVQSLHQRVWELHLTRPEVRIKQTLRQLLQVINDEAECQHIYEYWSAAYVACSGQTGLTIEGTES